MKTVPVNRFDNGVGDSKYDKETASFAMSKHFDTSTLPHVLTPYRGMASDITGQAQIGNLLIGSNGYVYGLGNSGGSGKIYKKDILVSNTWVQMNPGSLGGSPSYDCFGEYKARIYAGSGGTTIYSYDINEIGGSNSHALAYTNICAPFVHPSDDYQYFGYDNKIASNNNGSWTDVALTLPSNLTITALASWGNYLAIAVTPTVGLTASIGGGAAESYVILWDRSATTTNLEPINWGTGVLRVLKNYNGALIGVSDTGGSSSNVQDRDSVLVKYYSGGQPQLIKELVTEKQTTTFPDAAINPRVSFVYRNRFYFSANIVGGSTSPSHYGLWSLGKGKQSNRYGVVIERIATNDNSETGVIAAIITGDVAVMVHSAVGTITSSINTSIIATAYQATSVYESLVNPEMEGIDYYRNKQLVSVTGHFRPLTSSGQVVMKYRVDSDGDWTTIFTKTSTSPDADTTSIEALRDASGGSFTSGRQYEFRLESTGGAEIVGFTYKYDILNTNI